MKNKNDKKLVLATGFTILTLLTTMCATFAWFLVPKPNVSLDTVSGDMSISLEKLSAYRYVYPFYKDSNSYIDYSLDLNGNDKGKLKQFIIKNTDTEEIKPLDTIPNINTEGSYSKTALYLVGDSTFLGESSSTEFALSSGVIFSSSTDATTFTINDVNLSIGSHFTVARNDGSVVEFSSTTLDDEEMQYSNRHFTCKKAGIYNFSITRTSSSSSNSSYIYSIEITYQSRDDESILGMTLFDPTYAILNGNKNNDTGRSKAIYEQKTCLIYDIEIVVKNQTRNFTLSLDVKRKALSDEQGKINENQYNLSKYVTFRCKEYEEGDNVSNLFNQTFHYFDEDDSSYIYNKPDNYGLTTDSDTNTTSSDSSTSDEESNIKTLVFNNKDETSLSLFKDKNPKSYSYEKTNFHFYIAVDYSPIAISYFFEENQLSKVYDLVRDYTFYFSSIQQISSTNLSSTSSGGNA